MARLYILSSLAMGAPAEPQLYPCNPGGLLGSLCRAPLLAKFMLPLVGGFACFFLIGRGAFLGRGDLAALGGAGILAIVVIGLTLTACEPVPEHHAGHRDKNNCNANGHVLKYAHPQSPAVILALTVYFAAQSARAAGEAAKEAGRSVDIQVSIEQPMLIVSEIKVSTDPSRHHWIDFKIKNIGKTPAILMQYAASAEVCDVLPDQPSYGPSFVDAGIVLGHGDHIERSVRTKSSDRLRKGFTAYRVYFWGYFACEDMFGQRLEIGYAYTATAFAPLIRSEQTDRMAWVRVGGDAYNYNRRKKAS